MAFAFSLARELHMTYSDLCERMSYWEFIHWQKLVEREAAEAEGTEHQGKAQEMAKQAVSGGRR